MCEELYSTCCGYEMDDWPDSDICPNCGEHTDAEEREDENDDDDEPREDW